MSGISLEVIVFLLMFIVIFLVYLYIQWKLKRAEKYVGYMLVRKRDNDERDSESLQQDDIFNISSRVQNQENQWNSRDNAAYLSIEHITINHQMNKPPYNDAPPSYDEAMKIFVVQSGEASSPAAATEVPNVVVEAPKPSS